MSTRRLTKYCKLHAGDTLVNKYQVCDRIGKGRFSMVYSAECGGKEYAVKVYRKGSTNKEYFDNEYDICRAIRDNRHREGSSRVVSFVEAFAHLHIRDDMCTIHPCIVYNLYGDTVSDLLDEVQSGMTVSTAKSMIREILQGLQFMHTCGIIHTDIKASNVLLTMPIESLPDNNHISVVLADIGSATYTDKLFSMRIGTQEYLSPEAILSTDYGTPTDIWSAMCLLYEIISGDYLFDLDRVNDNSIFDQGSSSDSEASSGVSSGESGDDDDPNRWDDDFMLSQKHLAMIEGFLGSAPDRICRKGKEFYNRNGQLRDRPRITPTSISHELITNYRDITPNDCDSVERFIMHGLCYLPSHRATATELLADPWLQN